MTNPTELLARVRAGLDGVTEGPWSMETKRTSCGVCHQVGPWPHKWRAGRDMSACIYDDYPSPPEGTDNMLANARFIASARSDVPALADALESVMAERDALAAAKWAEKHTDTMNDMVLMGMARDESIAENVTLRARVAELEGALRPFDACVYNDNGDVTIDTGNLARSDWLCLRAALRAKAKEAGE